MRTDFIFDNRPDDISSTELRVEGTIPDAVRGRFVANGPGQTQLAGEKLHMFDAYGRVLAAHITESGVTLSGKHVQTPLYAAEKREEVITKRRLFTNKPSRWSNLFDLELGNSCMHNVFPFGDALVAAQDPGHFLLDPETLEVRGPLDYGGLLRKGMNATPMARRDPETGHLVAWLQKPGPKDALTIVELDDAQRVVHQTTVKVPPGLVHDIAFTESHYVVSRFGALAVAKVLWGKSPVFDAVKFEEATPLLHLIPKKGGAARTVALPERMHFHFFNAHDQDGSLVLDAIGYPGGVTFSHFLPEEERARRGLSATPTPAPEIVRYVIDLSTLDVKERVMPDIAGEAPDVNPAVRGKSYRYGYSVAQTPNHDAPDPGAYVWFGGLGKLDFEDNRPTIYAAPEGTTCGPPAFVPDPARDGEDAGYLLSWLQRPDEGTSTLAIFDAQDLEAGPVAEAHASELFGFISHAAFMPS